MLLSKLSQSCALALTLGAPALACVQYSGNFNLQNGYAIFNAALTDNGSQYCAAINVYVDIVIVPTSVPLFCNDGRSASFDPATGVVSYSYPGFSGSFGTVATEYTDGVDETIYWTANVWGC